MEAVQNEEKSLKVALLGNPNSGKTTLFNTLTGLHQKTGNFPGVTVEKKTGKSRIVNIETGKGILVKYFDLPGTYSLNPKSIDEALACDVIKNTNHPDYPDIAVIVVDPSSIKRGLFLATQVIEEKLPCILVLNQMNNSLEETYDCKRLSERLKIPVIHINASRKEGIGTFRQALLKPIINNTEKQDIAASERYHQIDLMLEGIIKKQEQTKQERITQQLDKIFTHKVWGFLIFISILFFIFQSIFSLAAYPMDAIEGFFIALSQLGRTYLPEGMLTNLFVEGILSGLSGVFIFIPQIALLFGFIAIL